MPTDRYMETVPSLFDAATTFLLRDTARLGCFYSASDYGLTLEDIREHVQVVVDVREFGTLGASDDSSVIQAALNHAGTLAAIGGLDPADGSGVVVLMPRGGVYVASNLQVPSFVTFDLNYCRIDATFGAVGYVIGNANVDAQHYEIRNGWIECRGVDIIGIKIDHTGGVFGANSSSPHPKIKNIRVTNGGSNSDCIQCTYARGMVAQWIEVRLGRDGIALLGGTTDIVLSDFIAEACRRDGVHGESASHNVVRNGKIGESGRYGLYMHSGCYSWSVGNLCIDNTGYPAPFTSSTPVQIECPDSVITGITVSRGDGNAIVLATTADRNIIQASVSPYPSGGTLTYGLLVPSGATGNIIDLTVNTGGSPAMTGLVDPASDLLNNKITVNARELSIVGGAAAAPGVYTPTITSVTNIAATTFPTAQWSRDGNIVTVFGMLNVDTTAGSTWSNYAISLPIASNFTAIGDLTGGGTLTTGAVVVALHIQADATNDRANVFFQSDAAANNNTHTFFFRYVIK